MPPVRKRCWQFLLLAAGHFLFDCSLVVDLHCSLSVSGSALFHFSEIFLLHSHSESSSTVSSNQSQESGYQSGPIQSTTYTSPNNAQGPLYEQRSTQTRRYPSSISSSPQKDLTQAKVVASQAPGWWLGQGWQSPFQMSILLLDKWY